MNKAERIDAEVEKKMDESGVLAREADDLASSTAYFLPEAKTGLAQITVMRTPNGKPANFIRMDHRHRWTLPELEALVAWAHEMLDDEPQSAP